MRNFSWFTILTVLLVSWLGFTYYFITQHSVVGKEAEINKTVVFDNVSIDLDSIVIYNFKHKTSNFNRDSDFKNILLSKLPNLLIMPYFKIMYLYSTPYEIDNRLYQTALFGKCIVTLNGSRDYHAYLKNLVSINVVDSFGASYSGGRSERYDEDNSGEIDFSIRGRDFPIERFQEGMKTTIKHLESGEEIELDIEFEDFTAYKHNDSLRKPFPFPI